MTQKLKVRLISPWTDRVETETAIFSKHISSGEADALLCEWAPDPELLTFKKRKAWYCCEPTCQFIQIEEGCWPEIRKGLNPSEFLYHSHPDPQFRVPHITHFQPLMMNTNPDRKPRGIAIVSNHGGSPRTRHPGIAYRNQFITHPSIDLFGRAGWTRYRAHWYSWPKAPKNYRGEIPGDWPGAEKRELQAGYKMAICLENMCEPYYFTEKFVEAVVAGCIPVYHAHTTLVDTVLNGAFRLETEAFDHDIQRVIDTCINIDIKVVHAQNLEWLNHNEYLRSTRASAVFDRIGQILSETES